MTTGWLFANGGWLLVKKSARPHGQPTTYYLPITIWRSMSAYSAAR